jgi:prepilin peptidase CpaA
MASEHLTALWTLLAVAAAADVAQRRVPNLVVAPLAILGLAAQAASGGAMAAVTGALTGLAVGAVLLLPWATGKLGGGDLKLLAATAIWLGPSRLLLFLALTAVAGAPVALATRLAHRVELRRALERGPAAGLAAVAPETVPYAAAVALGAFAAIYGGTP